MMTRARSAARAIYCGAIGLVRPGGDATFNVAIRTVRLTPGEQPVGVPR